MSRGREARRLANRIDHTRLRSVWFAREFRGLIKNFRPEIEERIAKFRAENGDVAFGGALKASFPLGETAVPDNLGLEAVRQTRQIGA